VGGLINYKRRLLEEAVWKGIVYTDSLMVLFIIFPVAILLSELIIVHGNKVT